MVAMPRFPRRLVVGLVAFLTLSAGPALAQRRLPPGHVDPRVVELGRGAVVDAYGAEDVIAVMVELETVPTAVVYAEVLQRHTKGRAPADRGAAEREAGLAAVAHARVVLDEQARVAFDVLAAAPEAVELYRVHRAFNGIALLAAPETMDVLRTLPGVKSVRPLEVHYPNNSTSVPFLGTPEVWDGIVSLGLGLDADGAGISIGIIDTGVDYQHADFGGTGLLADYQANNRTVITEVGAAAFPTAKVVGGHDFAGDAYTGGNAPVPDPDPMDCNGHGTHVAGSAAGFGVTSAGTTYAGTYTPADVPTIQTLKIGPGTAPMASLYALRVFGCTGSTTLTNQAIDWALDPNGDNDLSDHLDVINMSLGSSYGSRFSSSAIASDNAAAAGMIVVASAGNSGDTFFVTGSPGAGTRVVSTAASVDSGISWGAFGTLQVNTPGAIAGNFTTGTAAAFAIGPPPGGLTADVVQALDPADVAGPLATDGCSPLTNAAAVAGNIAIVDRGTCGFAVKAKNAQNAGAVGVIIANNASAFGNMAGFDETVVIPAVIVQQADGTTLKANLGGPLNVTLWSAADTIASFTSRGPRRASSPVRLKPDIAAPGLFINSAQTGVTCTAGACQVPNATGFLPGNQILNLSGTSMASPHMAGVMALLLQLHPDWTVEELKALAMNYATEDLFTDHDDLGLRHNPSRIGAGRVDPVGSALGEVIAMDTDLAGVVNVSFDSEVSGVEMEVHTVRVVNHGTTDQTYDVSLDMVVDAPGVVFSLPDGASVLVPAGDTVEIHVQMDADASMMEHTRDPTVAATQVGAGGLAGFGPQPRAWLTEESAFLTFSQMGDPKLRLPVYMGSRPASTMSAADSIATGGAASGSTTIALSGAGVCTGTVDPGPVCNGTFPTDEVSLVSPFELHHASPADPVNNFPFTDIQHVGVAWDSVNDILLFAVSTHGEWSSLNEVGFNVCIDANEDGVFDSAIFTSNGGTAGGSTSPQDAFNVLLRSPLTAAGAGVNNPPLQPNLVTPAIVDTATLLNNVIILPTFAANHLGMGDRSFRYRVVTCPNGSNCARNLPSADDCTPAAGTFFDVASGPFFFNGNAPGLRFANGGILFDDLPGAALPVDWNLANITANGSLGALLLHHHNVAGQRAEVVLVDGAVAAPSADLAIVKTIAPAVPALGQTVTVTLTVTNDGPDPAAAIQVFDFLPANLVYVSDDGLGTYVPATGLWTIPALANGASAVLNVDATVVDTDEICNLAQITAATPLDPDPSDNQSEFCVQAPRTADLLVEVVRGGPATVFVGDPVPWTVTITNSGADPAYALNTMESFSPVAATPTSSTPSDGVFDTGTGLWNVASLGPGVSQTLSYSINAPNMAGTLTNTVGTSSLKTRGPLGKAFDPNLLDNLDTDFVTVLSPADVTATKTVSGTFMEGGAITYTIVLTNTSAFDQQDNTGPELTDVLPSQVTLVSASATAGTAVATIATNTVTWDGVVPAGGSVTITIDATVNAGTAFQTVSNQATVNYDDDGNGSNEATAVSDEPNVVGAGDPTTFFVTSPAAISGRSKAVSGSFVEGGAVTYTIVLTNTGVAQLDNPGDEFVDVLPSALTLVSASATSGTAVATIATNTVTWNGAIAGGGSTVTITINATINAGTALQVVSNQGTVNFDSDGNGTNESSAPTDDPAVGGNADPTNFLVTSPASITGRTKTVSGDFVEGGAVTYTIVLTNTGDDQLDNPGDEFVDVLPSQLTLVSANATSGTATATIATDTVTWNGTIAGGGGSVTITIDATIDAGTAFQTVSNQGTVDYDADGNGTNETSAPTDDPAVGGAADPTDFFVSSPASIGEHSKSVSGTPTPGSTIVYTVTITNDGTSAQQDNPGDEFVDVLPAELILVGASATTGTVVANLGTNTVTWNGTLAANGGTVVITIEAQVDPAIADPTFSNQGTIFFDADGDGTNESSQVTDDPATLAADDATVLGIPLLAIPTLSSVAMVFLAVTLAVLGLGLLRRRAGI